MTTIQKATKAAPPVRAKEAPAWLRAVRANPSELVAQPLLLAAVLLAAGFAATGILAASASVTGRRSLQAVADGAAASIEFALRDAINPLVELRDVLENDSSLALHSAAATDASRGRVGAQHVAAPWIDGRATFHVCGPDAMRSDATAGLVARGVPRHDIFSEAFTAAADDVPATATGRRVRFARSGVEAVWSTADANLLDLAERVGVTLPGGCRVGQCETCRVELRSGQVSHRGDVAPPDPQHCLACVAVPVSDLEIDA